MNIKIMISTEKSHVCDFYLKSLVFKNVYILWLTWRVFEKSIKLQNIVTDPCLFPPDVFALQCYKYF